MTREILETDDWKLDAFLDWTPKYRSVVCTHCDGTGKVGGGLKSIDGARTCSDCRGAGRTIEDPKTPMPDIPPKIKEHLRRAWFDYVNKEDV